MAELRDALRDLPDAVFVDLLESDDAYRLVVDIAGAAADTAEVSVEDHRLRVEARREKDVPVDFRYRSEERALFVDFDVPLPPEADGTASVVSVERGVLTVDVPKKKSADAGGRNIPIEDGEDEAGGDDANEDEGTAGVDTPDDDRDTAGGDAPGDDGDDT
jgi:HSP20 family molecular chaperone IbpA